MYETAILPHPSIRGIKGTGKDINATGEVKRGARESKKGLFD